MTRDRLTWISYLMLAYFVMTQAALGPSMPFLRAELNLTYAQGGLHLTVFAVGSVTAGLLVDRLAAWSGRRVLLWGGGLQMALGALILTAGRSLAVTLPATFLMGSGGSTLLIMVQSVLTDHFPKHRATALTEANAIGSAGSVLTPLLIGGLQAIAVGWRVGIYTMVALWGVLMLFGLREAIPSAADPLDTEPTRRLKPVQNLTFGLIFFGAAAEWVTIAWSADLMTESLGLDAAIASSLLLAYFTASAVGRWVVSQQTATRPLPHLLVAMLLTGMVGFLVFWQVSIPWVSVGGLFVAGVGIANFFPLALALLMTNASPAQVDLISTRTSLAAGSAILVAPQVTGLLADAIGITVAVATVPFAIIMMALLLAVRMRMKED